MQEFIPNIPIYIQIMNEIKKRITTGTLQIGNKLPSVRELAEEMQVNPNTIQRSYSELEREGITETRRGMGTFIIGSEALSQKIKNELSESIFENFMRSMHEIGFDEDEIVSAIAARLEQRK